jgi:dihydrofolate reductase
MKKLVVFNSVSLDGYFVDSSGDMQWAHNPNKDEEWDSFVASNAKGGGVLVFGRVTYELMKNFWPTPFAKKEFPIVAERMNNCPKIVFSRTIDSATWNNTRLVKNGMAAEIRKLKNESDKDMAILGSGTLVSQLTREQLIDEYQFVMTPVILGKGRTMFEGLKGILNVKLVDTRTFTNGNVILRYVPRV